MENMEERVTAQVKSTISKLHDDMASAFASTPKTNVAADKELELTTYLLKLKEKELSQVDGYLLKQEQTLFNLIDLCADVASNRYTVKNIVCLLGDMLDCGVILWTQSGVHYGITSSDDSEDEAARFFISLLPVLSDEKTTMPKFRKGLQHYLVYTDDNSEDIKALLFVRYQKEFTGTEEKMAEKFAQLLFGLSHN